MRVSIPSCLFLAGVFMFHSCGEQSNSRTTIPPVVLNQCDATPPTVNVKNGKSLKWDDQDHNAPIYIVDFRGQYPTSSPFPVKLGVSDLPHKIQADPTCVQDHSKCDYTYYLSVYNSSSGTAIPCSKDPVVHVDF